MLKRLLLLAVLVIPTPALAGGARVHRSTQPHCEHSHRTYVYVPVPYRPRTRTITVYGGQSYYENLYRNQFSGSPYYGNVYQGNGAAYNPKPVEPQVIENPFVK